MLVLEKADNKTELDPQDKITGANTHEEKRGGREKAGSQLSDCDVRRSGPCEGVREGMRAGWWV